MVASVWGYGLSHKTAYRTRVTSVHKDSLTCHKAAQCLRKVELADQFPILRISPMLTPLPKADEAAVTRVEPGRASMPASQTLLMMNPLKVSRVTMEYGRRVLKKSLSWLMSRASLASKRARMTATGQRDASSLQDLRQIGGPMHPVLSVLERDAGTSCTKPLEIRR
jgi:hypothetical protein